jgi:glycosyltransferase involved in cell wall biosynthesis
MSVGVPVVAIDLPEIKAVVEKNNVGILCQNLDPHEIARSVREICEKKQPSVQSDNARMAYKKKYNWGVESKKFIAAYKALAEEIS